MKPTLILLLLAALALSAMAQQTLSPSSGITLIASPIKDPPFTATVSINFDSTIKSTREPIVTKTAGGWEIRFAPAVSLPVEAKPFPQPTASASFTSQPVSAPAKPTSTPATK